MKRILQSRIAKNAADTAQWIGTLNIPLHASNTAYFIVLSVFPALLLVLSGLRFTGLKLESLLELFGDFLPNALMDTVEGIITSVYSNASGAVAGVSALTALWSASKGLYGLLLGLNNIYGVSEDRGYFFTRAISVFYTLLLGIVILLTLVLHVFGNSLISMLKSIPIPGIAFLLELLDLRFFLLVCAALLGLYGVLFGGCLILAHLCRLSSFGVPYLTNVLAAEKLSRRDVLLRFPGCCDW